MRLLTILNPWAMLIAQGRKLVENRPARPAKVAQKLVGERVAIHAGLRGATPLTPTAPDGKPWPDELHHGHVVAVATIDRVEPPVTDGAKVDAYRDPDQWGIYWRDVVPLASPVRVKGGQGWLHLEKIDAAAYEAVMAQVRRSDVPVADPVPTSQSQIDTECCKPLDPWSTHPRKLPTSRIQVGDRIRKDLGDIEAFAERMQALGCQLQPIVVDPSYKLIAGRRRLAACELLGWDVEVRVVASLDGARALLEAERDENTERKDLTPEEKYRLAHRLLELEKGAAEERRAEGGRRGGRSGTADPQLAGDREEGRAATRAAKAAGLKSRKELERIGKVLAAAEADPSKQHLVDELNSGASPASVARRIDVPEWDKDSWCTDEEILDAVHKFWPFGVSLDPCANEWSKKLGFVRATVAWTIKDDALAQRCWYVKPEPECWTTCWFQPPYGDPLPLTKRLASEWDKSNLDEILALVKLDTSTEWWLLLEERAVAVVLFHHRLAHYAGDQRVKGSDFCSAMLLLTKADNIEERIDALREAFMSATVLRAHCRARRCGNPHNPALNEGACHGARSWCR
ncbi:MAG: DNA N-6-adenine-methyltransferase [Myxococcota bacterium]